MSSILNKPNFYKDLAFLDITPDDIRWYKDNLDGRLLSKIIKRRYLRHKTYDLFLDIMDKEYPNHVKYYPRKMLRTGCLYPQEWKIRVVNKMVDTLLNKLGYLTPLYYDERCNVCNEFVNRFDMNKYYDDEDTRAYCK